ncbi:MAG TPA: DAK2 domain-containing protein, partial [Anaerolineae bacterium]|nr:DAK2 domain-containing protein [Anaerolineae bacterium]
ARLAAAMDDDLRFIIGRAVHAADEAVQKTPELLPVLAQAGVVDSGGKGLFFLLEGMYRCLRGELVTPVREAAPAFAGRPEAVVGEYGFDVQFIIQGADLDVDQIRRDITQMGDSVLVVGDSRTVRVHVHSPEPGTPLNYGARLGYMSHIIVENMQAQYEKFVHGVGDGNGPVDHEVTLAPSTVVEDEAVAGQISVVAVVPGEGLQRVFKSLGADVIVSGGQTMNPSTEELLKAIESVQNNQVLVLPNNSNVIMAAQQAQQLSEKQVRVVPSKTIPQGISALLSMNHQADLDRNVELMRAALADVETGEVTTAVRAARFDGIEVQEGDVIGLHNDVLSAKGNTPEDVACTLLEQMHADEAEIITIYYGDSVSAGQAQALADELQELYPHQEVEVVEGGQPHYHYILSVE